MDACTKYQTKPSTAINKHWFTGKGILNKPLQKLPWTPRADYTFPKMEDLPLQWLSSAAKTLLGQKLPAVSVMRALFNDQEPLLDGIADKHHQLKSAVSVSQLILRVNKKFRSLPNIVQRMKALASPWKSDYSKIRQQLTLTANKVAQVLIIEDKKKEEIYFVSGRHNYRVFLLV